MKITKLIRKPLNIIGIDIKNTEPQWTHLNGLGNMTLKPSLTSEPTPGNSPKKSEENCLK